MSPLHRPHAPPARAAALPPEDSLRIAHLLDHTLNDVQRLYVDLLACLTSARRVDPSTGRALPPLDGDAIERRHLMRVNSG
jgi:hypothetical protein